MLTSYILSDWQGYLKHAEIDAIKRVVRGIAATPFIVVKIGAGAGTDSLAILEERPDAIIFSVDINSDNDPVYTNEHLRLKEAGLDHTGRVIRIWGNSSDVCKQWPIEIDFLFIDGDHTLAGCLADIDGWLPYVTRGGIVGFHDYGSIHWMDVKRAIDDRMKTYPIIEQVDTIIIFRNEAAL